MIKNESIAELIFVYNANSGVFSELKGALHKIVAPQSYECDLCKITYGALTIKKDWKTFLFSLPYTVHLYHKDEFLERFASDRDDFPRGFILSQGGNLVDLVTKEDFTRFSDVESLTAHIEEGIKNFTS